MANDSRTPVREENADGAGPFVIVCDHASNFTPPEYGRLGLPPEMLLSHIAWDPGALPVSRSLSAELDAPLLWPEVSRLVVDCNRDPDAPDLIVGESEGRPVPGNRDLEEMDRVRRLATVHVPYHHAVDARLARRAAAGLSTAVVAVHSFNPVYRGKERPWHVGIVFDDDRRLADPVIEALKSDPALVVGENQPYSPADGVYYTLTRHARSRRLPAVMIEIRNDLIADEAGQREWAGRLSAILSELAP
ncbi:MAG TPA: N-formylglutamate amidohydrolase [Bauldia sp.]|nr:N-formylglutamate amidohydrolase [Bauldia sp.]